MGAEGGLGVRSAVGLAEPHVEILAGFDLDGGPGGGGGRLKGSDIMIDVGVEVDGGGLGPFPQADDLLLVGPEALFEESPDLFQPVLAALADPLAELVVLLDLKMSCKIMKKRALL